MNENASNLFVIDPLYVLVDVVGFGLVTQLFTQ